MKSTLKTLLIAAALTGAPPVIAQETLPAATRLALPGDQHTVLEPLIGTWNVEMRVYPGPGSDPIISNEMSATREWILGGRYVQEELTGTFAGFESARLAIIGYNNLEQRFEIASFDTFEPGFMVYDGQATDGTISVQGVSIEAGFGPNPSGRHRDLRFDIEIKDGTSVERIFVQYPGEEEFLFVEQIFTSAE